MKDAIILGIIGIAATAFVRRGSGAVGANKYSYYRIIQSYYPGAGWSDESFYESDSTYYLNREDRALLKNDLKEYWASGHGPYRVINRRELNGGSGAVGANKYSDYEDEPDYDEDIFITDVVRGGYDVAYGAHEFIGHFDDYDEAEAAIKQWQKRNKYWPAVWFVDDHGGVQLN